MNEPRHRRHHAAPQSDSWYSIRRSYLSALERILTTRIVISTFLIAQDSISAGPGPWETTREYRNRCQRTLNWCRDQQNVVGRLQEECQSGDDPGDDEDGARGEDERQRLRGGRAVTTTILTTKQGSDTSVDGTEQWKRRRTDCRKRRRDI